MNGQDKLRTATSQIRGRRSPRLSGNPREHAYGSGSRIRLQPTRQTQGLTPLKVGVRQLYGVLVSTVRSSPARARCGNIQGPPCTSACSTLIARSVSCVHKTACSCPLPDPIPSIETAPDMPSYIRTHARHPPAAAQNHSMLLSHCCWPRNGPLLRPSFWARRGGWHRLASAPRGR